MQPAFTPGATATLVAGAASASVAISPTATQVELQNDGGATVFVRVGVGAQTAVATTDYPVLSGQSKIISVPIGADTLAGISPAGGTTLYVTSGQGI